LRLFQLIFISNLYFLVKTKELRPAIIRAREQGKGVRKISSFLNITPMMVSLAIKRFEETGSNQDRPKGRQEKTARNRRNIQRTKEMNQRNPTTKANSTRKLAKNLGIGRESARKLLREDLGVKPYKYLKSQKLTDVAKLKRLQRARAL
jgi:transposase